MTSETIPPGYEATISPTGVCATENMRPDFEHKFYEVDKFGDVSGVKIDEKTVFIGFFESPPDGEGDGMFNALSMQQGLIGTVHTDWHKYRIVTPSGSYMDLFHEHEKYYHVFHPRTFGMEPFPIWEKEPIKNLLPNDELLY